MIGIMMDFNVVLWGNRLRAVSARPYKALAKSTFCTPLRLNVRAGAVHAQHAADLCQPRHHGL